MVCTSTGRRLFSGGIRSQVYNHAAQAAAAVAVAGAAAAFVVPTADNNANGSDKCSINTTGKGSARCGRMAGCGYSTLSGRNHHHRCIAQGAGDDCERSGLWSFRREHEGGKSVLGSRDSNKIGGGGGEIESLVDEDTITADFVIVGHGHSGRAAVRTLKRLCPSASIVVVDPHLGMISHPAQGSAKACSNGSLTRYLAQAVTMLDSSDRVLRLSEGPPSSSSRLSSAKHSPRKVVYRHSILIATGSRASPPPSSLVDKGVRGRILELRSTTLPPHTCAQPQHQLLRRCGGPDVRTAGILDANGVGTVQPSLPPDTVRDIALMASSQGATVGILGSGLEALELAASLSVAGSAGSTITNRDTKSKSRSKAKNVVLFFGSAGPLASRLPRYLSTAVSKRLRRHGIDVHERSLIRYVSSKAGAEQAGSANGILERIEVHAAKVSDALDTKRLLTDLLIIAPPVDGPRGTGFIARPMAPSSLLSPVPSLTIGTSWSNMSKHGTITCYSDDGRIVVNAQLCAAQGIYAAGSCAKYPCRSLGAPVVAGEGVADASTAGAVAAGNMAAEYRRFHCNLKDNYDKGTRIANERALPVKLFSPFSLPIWRTDEVPCSVRTLTAASVVPTTTETKKKSPPQEEIKDEKIVSPSRSTSLLSMGIHALCVGRCDSDEMATHGFWWTNQSSDKRNLRRRHYEEESNDYELDEGDDDHHYEMSSDAKNGEERASSVSFMTRRTVRQTNSRWDHLTGGTRVRPVYGSGIVFYFDRGGTLRGIMTWGVPFTESANNCTINKQLLNRIKHLLDSNGGIAGKTPQMLLPQERKGRQPQKQQHLVEPQHMNFADARWIDPAMLGTQDLAQESKILLSIACNGKPFRENIFDVDGEMARPLHRYVPAKPAPVCAMGVLKRKQKGLELDDDEEDLFMRHEVEGVNKGGDCDSFLDVGARRRLTQQRSASLLPLYPMESGSVTINGGNNFDDNEMARRCRPPKEDDLWIRRDDANRSQSTRAYLHDMFQWNMRQGKFIDGTDAYAPAPTPQSVQNTLKKTSVWTEISSPASEIPRGSREDGI